MRSPRTRRRRPATETFTPPVLATGVRPFRVQRDDDEVGPSAKAEDDSAGVLDSYLNKRQIARTVPPAGAWSADGGTIQRYTVVDPDDLAAQKGATVKTGDIASTRYGSAYTETDYTVGQTGWNPRARKVVSSNNNTRKKINLGASGLPPFRVSESGLLAVPDGAQARNFYAEQDAVDQANGVFEAAGASVRLTSAGLGITVPQDPEDPESSETRALDKVHAAQEIPADDQNEARIEVAQTFPVMECNAFIRLVLGASATASRLAVLEKYGEGDEAEVGAREGDEPLVPIAWQMTRSKAPTANRVRNALAKNNELPDARARQGQIDYEQLDEETMSARSAKLGINDFAAPEVGEGFVIRSMRTQAALDVNLDELPQEEPVHTAETRREMQEGYREALDQLEQAEGTLEEGRSNVSFRVQEMMRTWGEHYAGVVAKDGADVVTLENYNRRQEVDWEHERIFNNLFRDFGAFRTLVSNEVSSLEKAPDSGTIQRLVKQALTGKNLQKKYRDALNEAQLSFIRGLQLNARTAGGNFFFQMYGPGEQSFHSAYKGTASNPMTLRIRESDAALKREAVLWLGRLDTLATGLRTQILAHPVTGATANVQNRVQVARLEHTRLTQDLADAGDARGALKQVEQSAIVAKNTLAMGVRDELCTAYETITGTQLAQRPSGFRALRQTVDTYVNSYSWYQRVGTRYKSITALQTLLAAIENY